MFKCARISAFAAMLVLSSSLSAPALAQYEYDDESATSVQEDRPVRTPVGGNANTARLQVRINELEEQVRRLQGALEQASFGNKQLKSQMEKMKGDMEFRLTALEKGAPATGAAATTTSEQPQNLNATAAPVNTGTISEEPEEPVKQAESSAPVPKFDSSSEHYSYAFKLMNQAKYAEAGNAFGAFTSRYSKDPLIGNAFYWLGETYYVRKDYVKAADSFRQGFESMPTGPKAGDNLLKLAMALGATGKEKESCIVLKQVVTKFGKTSGSIKSRAEQEMNRMDCR